MSLHKKILTFLAVIIAIPLAGCSGDSDDKDPAPLVVELKDDRPKSIARMWNEVLLEAIRKDFARPTSHARNLFHSSAMMYDAWAAYSPTANTYLLGKTLNGYSCSFNKSVLIGDKQIAREQALSFAMYRFIRHRFRYSPGAEYIYDQTDKLMTQLKYSTTLTSRDYSNGSAIGLGNHLADCYIQYGLSDGASERVDYANLYYKPVNPPLIMASPGNPSVVDMNRWQPLGLLTFIDQAGHVVPGGAANFLSAEWGNVKPFALSENDKTTYSRDGNDFIVYHDPGSPPLMGTDSEAIYKWAFSMVVKWASHLDPRDGVMMDISPASTGNIEQFPESFEQHKGFYDALNGGDAGRGRTLNPITGKPYTPQIVPRGDYARVLAEFWADGPNSEAPPGHWFVILNTVMDHPEFKKKFEGVGPDLGSMEYDIKAYFALGGAMHDSAVTAWGIKGWYDYIRPVSVIRAMSAAGQSSDPMKPSFSVKGMPLEPGYIELVGANDPLAGNNGENIGKVKVKSWKGPSYVTDPKTSYAGVDWILGEEWWPYQRASFVTPPFAGYISGHSTFSRAGAEVLTALTGSPYFPGGMSDFKAPKNEFLVFEDGPSVDITLQWATYRDASDQCSLSRIWGGIHPSLDDIPGRRIGEKIGKDAFAKAKSYY
ncbi:MAG: vanadium-dependent haloperoxidase [Cellvibrio sp.]|nr:vanadium-dependent haloperoxidase [Cellvibrio sp.]